MITETPNAERRTSNVELPTSTDMPCAGQCGASVPLGECVRIGGDPRPYHAHCAIRELSLRKQRVQLQIDVVHAEIHRQ